MLENRESSNRPPIPFAADALEVVGNSRKIATEWRRDRVTSHELLASVLKNAQSNPENPFFGQPDLSDKLMAVADDFYGKGAKRLARGVTPIVKKWITDAQEVASAEGADKVNTKHIGLAILKDDSKREMLGNGILQTVRSSSIKILESVK